MNVGNIQLVTPKLKDGSDGGLAILDAHRSQAGSDDYAPCIVISALRPRTHGSNYGEGGIVDGGPQPPDLLTSNTAEEQEQIEVTRWDEQPPPSEQIVGVVGGAGALSPTSAGGDSESMAKWQKRHSKMHILSLRFLRWARSITHQADACRRESDVVVVPKHVVMAAQQQQLSPTAQGGGGVTTPTSGTAGATISATGVQQQGTNHKQTRSGLPDLMEENEMPSTPDADNRDNSEHNRSRASTESPAFGSTYV